MSLSPNEIPQIQPTETGGQKSLNHLPRNIDRKQLNGIQLVNVTERLLATGYKYAEFVFMSLRRRLTPPTNQLANKVVFKQSSLECGVC